MSNNKENRGVTEIKSKSHNQLDEKDENGDNETINRENKTEKGNSKIHEDFKKGNNSVNQKIVNESGKSNIIWTDSAKEEDDQSNCDNLSTKETLSIGNKTELLDSYKRSPKTVSDGDLLYPMKRNIGTQMSHIRMEEIQWQRLLERKMVRDTQKRELEQKYRDEIKAQIRNIEKQKRNDGLVMKRRMVEFERRRRVNNLAFCRMFQKKGMEYQIENEALYHRITEIDKKKQKNLEKLKSRVTFLEQRKQREQEMFLQRIEELDRRREEEYEASQKRLREVERKKYNEKKAWLLHVQKIEGLKKEIFKDHEKTPSETNTTGTGTGENYNSHLNSKNINNSHLNSKNIKDQGRIMEDASNVKSRYLLLPKIHHKKINIDKAKDVKTQQKSKKVKNTEKEDCSANNNKDKADDDTTVEFKFDVTVLT